MIDDPIHGDVKAVGSSEKHHDGPKSTPTSESSASSGKEAESHIYARTASDKLKYSFSNVSVWFRRDAGFWTAAATVLMAITTIVYTHYAKKQWIEMQDSGKQTDRLLCLYQQQLAQLTKQADDTGNLAVAAGKQADAAGKQVYQATIQAQAAKISAVAARNAAETANESLHVSERAYIVTGLPRLDTAQKSVVIPFINTGHIPSGLIQVEKHEMLANSDMVPDVNAVPHLLTTADVAEKHWSRVHFQSIVPGTPQEIGIVFDQMSADKLNSGMQLILIAGQVSYNDGFDGSTQHRWLYCFRSLYVLRIKQLIMTPCDPDVFIPKLELLDGYPNNEEKDNSLSPN